MAKALPSGRVLEALEEALLRDALDRAAPAPVEHHQLVAVHHTLAHAGFERLVPLTHRRVLDLLDLDQLRELVQAALHPGVLEQAVGVRPGLCARRVGHVGSGRRAATAAERHCRDGWRNGRGGTAQLLDGQEQPGRLAAGKA
jgi:hypothetical protein